jgi:hypothetical protein
VDAQVSSMNANSSNEIELSGKPLPTLFQDVRALLLLGVRGLF